MINIFLIQTKPKILLSWEKGAFSTLKCSDDNQSELRYYRQQPTSPTMLGNEWFFLHVKVYAVGQFGNDTYLEFRVEIL